MSWSPWTATYASWAEHRVRLESGIIPVVPAPVVAQVSRSPAQVQLRRLLRGCEVVNLTEPGAHAAGQLLGRAGTSDVVDAVVAQTAAPVVPGRCQAGNPALLPVIPTITRTGQAGMLAGMASGSGSVGGDGGAAPDGQSVETLGIADVVMTILQARKTMPWATAAAVSRESRGDVIHVRVRLLESSERPEDQPGLGDVVAAFTAHQLGADLAAAFGSKDRIILK